jgi:hypothetical protein
LPICPQAGARWGEFPVESTGQVWRGFWRAAAGVRVQRYAGPGISGQVIVKTTPSLFVMTGVLGKVYFLVLSFLLTDLKNGKFLKDSPDTTFMVFNIENKQFTRNTIINGIG